MKITLIRILAAALMLGTFNANAQTPVPIPQPTAAPTPVLDDPPLPSPIPVPTPAPVPPTPPPVPNPPPVDLADWFYTGASLTTTLRANYPDYTFYDSLNLDLEKLEVEENGQLVNKQVPLIARFSNLTTITQGNPVLAAFIRLATPGKTDRKFAPFAPLAVPKFNTEECSTYNSVVQAKGKISWEIIGQVAISLDYNEEEDVTYITLAGPDLYKLVQDWSSGARKNKGIVLTGKMLGLKDAPFTICGEPTGSARQPRIQVLVSGL